MPADSLQVLTNACSEHHIITTALELKYKLGFHRTTTSDSQMKRKKRKKK